MKILFEIAQRLPSFIKEHLLDAILFAIATGVAGNFVYDAIKPSGATAGALASQSEAAPINPEQSGELKPERLYIPSNSIVILDCRGRWLLTHNEKQQKATIVLDSPLIWKERSRSCSDSEQMASLIVFKLQ